MLFQVCLSTCRTVGVNHLQLTLTPFISFPQLFLQSLAELKPTLDPKVERELLIEIRLASVPAGFSYLQQSGFISAQMDYWAFEFNYRFVFLKI